MVRRRWLFGLILTVPLVGLLVSQGIQAYSNSQLRSALRQNAPDANPDLIAGATLSNLCAVDSSVELAELCSHHANIVLLGTTSVWTAVAGITMVALIWLAGVVTRSDRRLLVVVFRPGLYITAIVVVGLVVVHAGIAMAAIYFGESAVSNRIHAGIILAIGLGAALGVWSVARSILGIFKNVSTTVVGLRVGWQQAPQLWKCITELASRLGSTAPQHIVLGLDPNFFVTEADVVCLDGRLTGRTLYCSLPLCRILSKPEFLSIIGHELGHFRGEDTKFSQHFYPIYRGTSDSIAALQQAGGEGAGAIGLLPAIAVFSYFLESFAVAENHISREREFEADRAGVSVTSAKSMASALVKVHAFSHVWSSVAEAAAAQIAQGQVYVNVSNLYSDVVVDVASERNLTGITEVQVPHPTDSHPPLSARLDALKLAIKDVTSDALAVAPDHPAIDLMSDFQPMEERLTAAFNELLAHGVPHDASIEQPAAV